MTLEKLDAWTLMITAMFESLVESLQNYKFQGHDYFEMLRALQIPVIEMDGSPDGENQKRLTELLGFISWRWAHLESAGEMVNTENNEVQLIWEIRWAFDRFIQSLLDTEMSNYDELLKGLKHTEDNYAYFKAASMLTEIMWT